MLEEAGQRQDFYLYIFMQFAELGCKLTDEFDDPGHSNSMTYDTYVVKSIIMSQPRLAVSAIY